MTANAATARDTWYGSDTSRSTCWSSAGVAGLFLIMTVGGCDDPSCSTPGDPVPVSYPILVGPGRVRRVGDLYELVLSIDLRGDITDDELAELRWHVGQGPRPERLPIGTDAYLE